MSQQPKPKIYLSTRRLITRTILPHEKHQYDFLSTLPPSLAPLYTHPTSTSPTSTSHYLFVLSRRTSHHTPQYSVSDGTIFGIIHISVDSQSNTAELSFKALKQAEENVYMEEVMPKVVDYVFDALPVKQLRVLVENGNRGAQKVMWGLGVRGVDGGDDGGRSVRYEFEKFAWKCRGRGGR